MTPQQEGSHEMGDGVGPLLELRDVTMHYRVRKSAFRSGGAGLVRAVDGVSLQLDRGETLALVGESGCGKSTLARIVLGLQEPSSGSIEFEGLETRTMRREARRRFRTKVQMVFQDPFGSLNPRRRVGSILEDPFIVHKIARGSERKKLVRDLMLRVGLSPEHYNRFPGQFSGGQRQRVGIARALALNPTLVVCDEPVSALDVSIQAQILNLLDDLQQSMGLSYLFIAHDLSVVRHVSTRVAVMYLGRVVEQGPVEDLYNQPRHPYTAVLLSSVPTPDGSDGGGGRERIVLSGDVPSPMAPPSGCRFHPRCPIAQDICKTEQPELAVVDGNAGGRRVACHFPLQQADALAQATWIHDQELTVEELSAPQHLSAPEPSVPWNDRIQS